MVSRRNYMTIAIMFLILFFMFQFTGVMKDQLNKYGVNEYEMSAQTDLNAQDAFDAQAVHSSADTPKVFYVGAQNVDIRDVVYWWCTYSKRAFCEYTSLSDCSYTDSAKPDMIVLDGQLIRTEADVAFLQQWSSDGINLVFARMPDVAVIRADQTLEELLGIDTILKDDIQLTGMHLFDGFLLGGEAIYEAKDDEEEKLRQDMDINIPWYVTGSGTKTYMVGLLADNVYRENMPDELRARYTTMDDDTVENMVLPAVIWRHGLSDAGVFCVNGDFLSDISGIGILEAMMAESNSYDIYPVVNAQNLVVANFPAFVSENEQEMQRLYSQSASAVYKEIIWPSLTALNTRTGMRMSCMFTPQFDYENAQQPDGSNVAYYLKLLKEEHSEAGLSGTTTSQLGVSDKLSLDETFWKQYTPDYVFRSLYLEDSAKKSSLSDAECASLKTLIVDEKESTAPIVSYAENGLTEQRVTSTGVKHTFMDDFKLKSMETALAYSNITLDLYNVTYPQSDEDSWQNLMKKISANLATFWKDYRTFAQTSVSEGDLRIRRFLALDYTQERKDDRICVSMEHFEEQAWFLLRLNGEQVTGVQGGEYVQVEDGVYLIEAQEEYLNIDVAPLDELRYNSRNEQQGGSES